MFATNRGCQLYSIEQSRLVDTDEAQQRRSEIINMVLDAIKQVKETDNGYNLRFDPNDENFVLVSDWLQVERICNPFLRFNLTIESNSGPFWLDLAGPAGTKDFLSSELAISRWL